MKVALLAPLPPPSGGIASWTVRYKDYCDQKGIISLQIVNNAMIGDRATVESKRVRLADEFKRTIRIIHMYRYL